MNSVLRSSPSVLFVLLACAATVGSAAGSGCTRSGCPSGSTRAGDRCVPLDCTAENASFFADVDGDGHGDPASMSCTEVVGYVEVAGDCDDHSTTVNPDATEICNGVDDDCDGTPDETFECASGLGSACETACGSVGTRSCSAACVPVGECLPPPEQCNGMDDDCDGSIDEGTLVLAEAGPIGSAGDLVLGIAASEAGYVAFLRRGNQIVAQPLDPAGAPVGAEVPMFESTPPDLQHFGFAANATTAYVLYVSSNTARVRSFALEASAFGASADLLAATQGFAGATIAASDDRVVALLMPGAEGDAATVGTVSIDADLTTPTDFAPLYEGPPHAVLGYLSLALAAPGLEGAPWVATYCRVAEGELPTAKMLVGVSATGDVAVAARPLVAPAVRRSAVAVADGLGLVSWTEGGTVQLQPFDASTLAASAEDVVSSDSGVTSALVTLDRALGQWAVAYVREAGDDRQVSLALFADDLAREDVIASIAAPAISALDAAGSEDRLAVLVGLAGAQPRVLVLGCGP